MRHLRSIITSALAISLLITFAVADIAFAAEQEPLAQPPQQTVWFAHLLRRKDHELRINHLDLDSNQAPIYMVGKGDSLRPLVKIKGKFDREGWQLFAQGNFQIAVDPQTHQFETSVYLKGAVSDMLLTAKGPNGELQQERFYIYAPEAHEIQLVSSWSDLVLYTGISGFNYFQTDYGSYRAATGLLGAKYSTLNHAEKYGIAAGADLTLLTMASNPEGNNPQFFQGHLDGTFRYERRPNSAWQMHGLFGFNYLTMIVNRSSFGITNLIAPELGFRFLKYISPKRAIELEFRFVPLGGFSGPPQYGVAIEAGLSRILSNSHRVELNLDFSGYNYQPAPAQVVQTGILALKLGYSL